MQASTRQGTTNIPVKQRHDPTHNLTRHQSPAVNAERVGRVPVLATSRVVHARGPLDQHDAETPCQTPADQVESDVDSGGIGAAEEEDAEGAYGPEERPAELLGCVSWREC